MEYKNIPLVALVVLFVLVLLLFFLLLRARRKNVILAQQLNSEIGYKNFMNFLPFPVLYEKKDSKSIFANKAFEILFNINKKSAMETLFSTDFCPVEKVELLYDNNIKKKVIVYSSRILDENKNITATLKAVIDIDELQSLINSLLEKEERYELCINSTLFGIWDWDIENDIFYVSEQWKQVMGYKTQENPKNINFWLNLIDTKSMAHMNQAISEHLRGKTDLFSTEHGVRFSEEKKWISVVGKAVFNENNEAIRFSGMIFDISDKKHTETIKSQSQRLFTSFMENLPAIAFVKDTDNRYVYLNKSFKNYLSSTEWKNKTPLEVFDKRTASEVIESDRKAFYEGIREHEEALPNTEGELRHFKSYKFPIDAGNNEKFLCGFGIDVTQEKSYLKKINMYAKIFDNTAEGILVMDENFNITAINKAFETNMGYREDEVLGKNPKFLKPADEADDFYDNLNKTLKEKNKYSGEILIRTKQGTIIPELVSIGCIRNTYGKITNYFAIYQSIVEQKRVEKKLKKLAQYDTLTKLPNRFLFKHKLSTALEKVRSQDIKVALVFVDLDNFKNFNDTLGHDSGDIILRKVAEKLSFSVRRNDTVARLGGDEFVVILEDIQSIENLKNICNKILTNLNRPFKILNSTYQIRASLGVSISPNDTLNYNDMLKYADKAMYEAKNNGKNRIVINKSV